MDKLFKVIFRMMMRLKGYKIYIVESENEEAEIISFSARLFLEEGYAEEYIPLLERYYENSVLFAVRHKGNLIAATRLIDPRGNCRINDFWNVKIPDDVDVSELRELGMMVIDKKYRGKSRIPFSGMLDRAFEYSNQNGIKCWHSSAYEEKYLKFRKMNPSCRILEKLEPEEQQLKFRKDYADYFKQANPALIFVFNLKAASYSNHVKRVVKRKLGFKTLT